MKKVLSFPCSLVPFHLPTVDTFQELLWLFLFGRLPGSKRLDKAESILDVLVESHLHMVLIIKAGCDKRRGKELIVVVNVALIIGCLRTSQATWDLIWVRIHGHFGGAMSPGRETEVRMNLCSFVRGEGVARLGR